MKNSKIEHFLKKENEVLTEIYRNLNYFHNGNLDERLMFMEYPSKVKPIMKFGLIKPYNTETPKQLNWYSLTDKGKLFFKRYLTKSKLSEEINFKIFNGEYVKQFNKKLIK